MPFHKWLTFIDEVSTDPMLLRRFCFLSPWMMLGMQLLHTDLCDVGVDLCGG